MIIPQLNPEVTAIGIEFLEISHSFLFFNLGIEQMFAGLCSLWDFIENRGVTKEEKYLNTL